MEKTGSALVTTGGGTLGLTAIGAGARWGFPDMIVPFGWAMALIAFGVFCWIATAMFAVSQFWPRNSGAAFLKVAASGELMRSDSEQSPEKLEYQTLTKFVARKERIDEILPKVCKIIQDVEAAWTPIETKAHDKGFSLAAIKDGRSKHWPVAMFVDAVTQAQRQLLINCGNIETDLARHDEYNRNPHHYLGPLNSINDELKGEYRRYYNMHEHAMRELKAVEQGLQKERDEVVKKITGMG